MIRVGTLADVSALARLESESFTGDRLSLRQFRYLLSHRANAGCWVWEDGGEILAYVLLLFRRKSQVARLYSIAVGASARGKGIGQALIQAAEREALDRGSVEMRLEIRQDNPASIRLFEGAGYKQFGAYLGYYEDGMHAWRYRKVLKPDHV